jgi:hypothetical protein
MDFSELKFALYKKFFRSLLDYASYLTGPIFRHVRLAVEKRQQASMCLTVRLSIRMYQPASHWTDFREI